MKECNIPRAAIQRLSLYLRQLESFQRSDHATVSSTQLGEALGLTDAQVRKDLAYFGQFGHPGVGYRVEELISEIKRILGTNRTWNVALVGTGNLGRALVTYRGFEKQSFEIVAIFDNDAREIGSVYGGLKVISVEKLAEVVNELGIKLGIIAVPADAAPDVAHSMIEAGIKGILNFAPITIPVPEHITLLSVDLAVQLEQLSFQINERV